MRKYSANMQAFKLGHIKHSMCVAGFSTMPWPRLRHLGVSSKRLAAPAAASLARADMPELIELCLCNCKLTDAVVEKLLEGKWLKLQSLDLSNKELGDHAMSCRAKGQWPLLRRLSIDKNDVSPLGFTELLDASWLELSDLTMDMKCASLEYGNPLCLDMEARQAGWSQKQDYATISRLLEQMASSPHVFWPKLVKVCISLE